MNLDEAHYHLDRLYQEVRENEQISNPVAYALYQAWKLADTQKKCQPLTESQRRNTYDN